MTVALPWLLPARALADIALSAIAALFLLHSFLTHDSSWCKKGWVRILTALWMLMLARGLFTPHMHEALARALPFVRYFMFAGALSHWILPDARIRRLFLLSLTVALLFWAADGLLQRMAGVDILLHPVIRDPVGGHIRLTGIFGRPILGIMLAWLCFPAGLFLLYNTSPGKHILPIAACALMFFAVALSGERMALLLVLLGAFALAILLPCHKRYVCGALAACLAAIALLALASPMFFQREIGSTFTILSHWGQSPYGQLLASDMRLAGLHPWLGVGANQFRSACPSLYPGDPARIAAMCNLHPHNIYMEWWIEEGIAGLGLFIAFLVAVGRQIASGWACHAQRTMLGAFAVAFLLRVWPLASSTSFFSSWGAPPFWLITGALLAYAQIPPADKEDAC